MKEGNCANCCYRSGTICIEPMLSSEFKSRPVPIRDVKECKYAKQGSILIADGDKRKYEVVEC